MSIYILTRAADIHSIPLGLCAAHTYIVLCPTAEGECLARRVRLSLARCGRTSFARKVRSSLARQVQSSLTCRERSSLVAVGGRASLAEAWSATGCVESSGSE
eukprot:212628-Pleurochrysis_carterae.AAC.2